MKSHIFSRRFSVGGLCATLTIFQRGGMVCHWNRRPTKEQLDSILPEYLDFKRDAMQTLTDEIGGRVLDVVEVSPGEWMPISYAPKQEGVK